MRVLALITDAFGGHGGIALYNRDFLTALCENEDITEVVAIPRVITNKQEEHPVGLVYDQTSSGNFLKYILALIKCLIVNRKFDVIICGHINLIPIAWLVGKLLGAPVVLEIYGIEAWQPTKRKMANRLVNSVSAVTSISNYTLQKFKSWTNIPDDKYWLLPNAIHAEDYGVGEKSPLLMHRYGVEKKTVLLTLGRLVSKERAKGFDEIIEILPKLIHEFPDVVYIIAGDGNDRSRLEEKAVSLGMQERVVFTGMVEESEKADLYRLADAYVMPSRGEGFGFVFLEAMACGVPVLASKVDGSLDAVCNGELGGAVDPDNSEEVLKGVIETLRRPRGIPDGLNYFSFNSFKKRLGKIILSVSP